MDLVSVRFGGVSFGGKRFYTEYRPPTSVRFPRGDEDSRSCRELIKEGEI